MREGAEELSPGAAQDTGDAGGSGPWLPLLGWAYHPRSQPHPAAKGGNKTKIKKKVPHLGLFMEKRGGNGFKITEEGKVCRPRRTFLFRFQKPHKAERTQFKRAVTAWAPQASLHPTGKGHSFKWGLKNKAPTQNSQISTGNRSENT